MEAVGKHTIRLCALSSERMESVVYMKAVAEAHTVTSSTAVALQKSSCPHTQFRVKASSTNVVKGETRWVGSVSDI